MYNYNDISENEWKFDWYSNFTTNLVLFKLLSRIFTLYLFQINNQNFCLIVLDLECLLNNKISIIDKVNFNHYKKTASVNCPIQSPYEKMITIISSNQLSISLLSSQNPTIYIILTIAYLVLIVLKDFFLV